MTEQYFEITATRGKERPRTLLGTAADILRFENNGYAVTKKETDAIPPIQKVGAVGVTISISDEQIKELAERLCKEVKLQLSEEPEAETAETPEPPKKNK